MPSPLRTLTLQGARDHVRRRCASAPAAVGLETEWIVVADDPAEPVRLDAIEAAVAGAGPLPCGSRITFEPGGQLELSGPPGTTVADGVNGMAADLAVIDRGLDAAGLRRLGAGVDPWRPP